MHAGTNVLAAPILPPAIQTVRLRVIAGEYNLTPTQALSPSYSWMAKYNFNRRRLAALAVIAVVAYFLIGQLFPSSSPSVPSAWSASDSAKLHGSVEDEVTAEKLQQSAEEAGDSVGKDAQAGDSVASVGKDAQYDAKLFVDELVNSFPIVIFAKSKCPFSINAKKLLLEKLQIYPTPFVFDLDLMPHFEENYEYIKSSSGRQTVPNIYVGGVSRGGFSDFDELGPKLPEKILLWSSAKAWVVDDDHPAPK